MSTNWVEVKLGDLGRVVTGKTPPTSEQKYFNGSYNFISPKDMKFDSRYIESSLTSITSEAIIKFKNQTIPKNTVMFTALSYGFGKIGLANNLCLTNQQINSIIVDNTKYDYIFVYYLLRNSKEYFLTFNAGIVTPIVPKSTFEKIKVLVPRQKSTQQKIAHILSAYDDLIENNLKRIKLLEEMAQITYEEWFVRIKFPGHKQAVFDTETGLPEGWRNSQLQKYIKFIKGKKVVNSTDVEFDGSEKILLLDSLESGRFKYTSPKGQVVVERGDVVMLMDGARSSCVFYTEKGVVGSTLAKLEVEDIPASLLYHFFLSHIDWLIVNNTGAAIPHANKSFINRINFVLPDQSSIARWNKLVDPLNESIWKLKDQNQLLKEARDILLPRLMTGMINVETLSVPEPLSTRP